ncbi:MAG: metal-dependent transcriptional regulator [Candidatus Gastranaerophilales bacterium]|nr:metal-dependent transcriptional regulator [Candidatus Gastranaerophilales bacterium]
MNIKNDDNLTKSLEKYLLAISLIESAGKKNIKVKDVANYLKIGGPSTADAIKTLKERGYINYEPYQDITLTAKGIDKINLKKYRQNTITNFLTNVLEIDNNLAMVSAENIEFSIPEVVLQKFVHFLDFMEQCSCKEPKWVTSCKNNLSNGEISQKCRECISSSKKSCCCGGCSSEK